MPTNSNSGRDGQVSVARKLLVLIEALSAEGAYIDKKEVARRLGLSDTEAHLLFYLLLSTDRGEWRPFPFVSDDSLSYIAAHASLQPSLFDLRPALTYSETLSLAVVFRALKISADSPLQKLLSPPVSSHVVSENLIDRVVQPEVSDTEQTRLFICAKAIAAQQKLLFSYQHTNSPYKNKERPSDKRSVLPLEVIQDVSGWKLEAFDLKKHDTRTFFIHRMENLKTASLDFEELRQAYLPAKTADVPRVTLFFDDKKYLSLFEWHDLQIVQDNTDDALSKPIDPSKPIVASVPFFKNEWLPRHVLACHGHVWADDPALINDIQNLAQKLLCKSDNR